MRVVVYREFWMMASSSVSSLCAFWLTFSFVWGACAFLAGSSCAGTVNRHGIVCMFGQQQTMLCLALFGMFPLFLSIDFCVEANGDSYRNLAAVTVNFVLRFTDGGA